MLELNKLYLMDCMKGMAHFPDKYFELAIVDPPYGINIDKMSFTKSGAVRIGKAVRRDYRMSEDWDYAAPDAAYFDELFRISEKQIIWGWNHFANRLPPTKSVIVWDKRVADKQSNDFSDCELAWASQGVARVFRYLWKGMIQGNMKDKEPRFHPTQKPVALYRWLLDTYAKPGDKILDTHVGSASSLIACYQLGFEFCGFEIDADYHAKASERLSTAMAQGRLFGTEAHVPEQGVLL